MKEGIGNALKGTIEMDMLRDSEISCSRLHSSSMLRCFCVDYQVLAQDCLVLPIYASILLLVVSFVWIIQALLWLECY